MNNTRTDNPISRTPLHVPSLLLLIMSGLGLVGTFGIAIFLLIRGFVSQSLELLTPTGLIVCGSMLFPVGYYSSRRLKRLPVADASLKPIRWWQVLVVVFTWLGLAILTGLLDTGQSPQWLLLLPFVLAMLIPIGLLVWVGIGGLPLGSRQRVWGTFGIAIIGGPLLAILFEVMFYFIIIVAGGLILALNPAWLTEAKQVLELLKAAPDMDQILEIVGPYLLNPIVIGVVFIFAAILTPLIEELVKPIGIWFLGKRIRTPQEGFTLGAISGAGFALVEALLSATSSSGALGALLFARGFASLMHVLATGLMCRGIAQARQQKKFLPLLKGYGLAFLLHSTWNGSVVIIIYAGVRMMLNPNVWLESIVSGGLIVVSLGTLLLVALTAMVSLPLVNKWFRNRLAHPVIEPAITEAGIIPQLSLSEGQNGTGTQAD